MKKEKEYMMFSQTCIPPLFLFGVLVCMWGTVIAGIFDQYILVIILFVLFFICIGFTIWAFKKFRFRIDKNGVTLWRGDFYPWEAFTDAKVIFSAYYSDVIMLWIGNKTIKLRFQISSTLGYFKKYCTNEIIYLKLYKDFGGEP